MDLEKVEVVLVQTSTGANQLLSLVRQIMAGKVFEEPLPNGTLGGLLARALQDFGDLRDLFGQIDADDFK